MNQTAIPILLAAFVPLVALAVAVVIDRRRRAAGEKPPQTEKLLRPPGHSLARRLEQVQDRILDGVLWACLLCAIAGAGAAIAASFVGVSVRNYWGALAIIVFYVFGIAGAWEVIRVFRKIREAQNLRLGLRGEQAVAEALHEVGDAGFRIFHDLPGGEDWNIDHVAAGPCGVFLIETKARRRRRRRSRNGQPEHEVVFDGAFLQFPFGRESKPIEQAKINAKWLSSFLEKKTGEPVRVEPFVVLPGWFVRNSENRIFAVKAMNANYLTGFLRRQEKKIEPAQVRRIITALDDKCRDVDF